MLRHHLISLAAVQVLASGCLIGEVDPGPAGLSGADSGSDGGDRDAGSGNDGGSPQADAGREESGAADAGQDSDAGRDSGGGSGTDGGGGGTSSDGGSSDDSSRSAGCGKAPTLQSKSTITIQSGGLSRKYILWLPGNYDKNRPYRLVLAYHWYTGSAQQVVDCNSESIKCYTTQSPYFGLWNLSNDSTIFVAPDGIDAGWANTNGRDLTFTDDILKQIEADLCIDKTRIFANGFSYGGAMSATLACARPKVFRAVAVYAGGLRLSDPGSACSGEAVPIAYYASHGTGDSGFSGGQAAVNHFVQVNGCTAQTPALPPSGGHSCTSFQGCASGYPVRWCAFDGGHTPSPVDRGASATWNPKEVWAFFTQF